MLLPRDSSDIKIALACPVCSGNGGIGTRRHATGFAAAGGGFDPCDTCSGTGWIHKCIPELSPTERQKLTTLLDSTKPDAPPGTVQPPVTTLNENRS